MLRTPWRTSPGLSDLSRKPLAPARSARRRIWSSVSPGYLVLDPYSYSNAFNIGAVPAAATSVSVQFVYDFLVQTTPTSSEYAKQTASDSLVIAIARD